MIVSIDAETHPFEPGRMAPRIVCLSHYDGKKSGVLLRDEIPRYLGTLLKDPEVIFTGWSVSYDFVCIADQFRDLAPYVWKAYEEGRIHCARVRELLLDIATGSRAKGKGAYSLASVVKRAFSAERDKETFRTNYAELDGLPVDQWPKGAVEYALHDAKDPWDLYQRQEKFQRQIHYDLPDAPMQSAYCFALRLVHCWGIHTDPDAVEALQNRTSEAIEELQQDLIEASILRKVGSKYSKDTKLIQSLVTDSYPGIVPRTERGAIQTTRKVLEDCHSDILDKVIRYKELEKSASAFISKLAAGVEYPLHPSFDVLGASSGRVSCFDPNLQQQPRIEGVRQCFIPRPGNYFVSCDFDSQELRTLAESLLFLVGRSTLATRYQGDPNYDPHLDFAARRLGISYEKAQQRKAARDKEIKQQRQRAKIALFGIPGGMGVPGLKGYARGFGLRLDDQQAADLKGEYMRDFPEMWDFFDYVRNLPGIPQGPGELATGVATLPVSGRRRGGLMFTSACNFFFQGPASDCSKYALWETVKKCYLDTRSDLYGTRPVNFVHDEIMIEAPKDQASAAGLELEKTMVGAMSELCVNVPVSASAALSRRWEKEAEPVYNAKGELMPWEPDLS